MTISIDPEWEPSYVASPGWTKRPVIVANIAFLIPGGVTGSIRMLVVILDSVFGFRLHVDRGKTNGKTTAAAVAFAARQAGVPQHRKRARDGQPDSRMSRVGRLILRPIERLEYSFLFGASHARSTVCHREYKVVALLYRI